jgi:hypothetical protein
MTANLDDKLASRFLKILDEKAKSFTYQTFHDTEAKEKNPALAHIIAGPAHDRLLDLHERGAGIYVTVNETSDKAIRRDANIIRVRAVWREADAANLPELPIEPSLIVKTSPGHSHEYFLVADDWPADAQGRADFAAVMERMVETYKSDKNAKDLCRVLRVPGFLHRKHEPHLIRISKPNGGGEQVRRYTRAEILAAFPPVERPKKPDKPQQRAWTNDDHDDLERARDALIFIDADDRDIWLKCGMALNDRFGEAGRRLWDEWSASSSKYDARDQEKNWRSFGRRTGITIATLFGYAQQAGWCGNSAPRFNGSGQQQSAEPRAPPSNGKDGAREEAENTRPWEKADAPDAAEADAEGLNEQDFGARTTMPPPREWLLGTTFCRTFFSSLIAAGGVGKTAVRYAQFLALASGRAITGEHVHHRSRVLVISLEDDDNELCRRMLAAMMHNNITHEDIKGWLFTSAPRRAAGKLLEIDKFGRQIKDGKLAANIETAIIRRKPDLVSLDPFVKTHSVGENENTLIDEVAQILTDLGAKHNIAIDAPHHVSKGTTDPGNADKGRGASSLVDAARLVKTLTQMSADEARAFGIPQEDRKQYVRVDNGKVNLSRSGGAAQWFELIGVAIGNGNDRYPNGDTIQVAKPWKPPEIWSDLPEVLLNKILDKIDEGMADGERYIDLASAKKRAAWPIVVGMAPHKTEEQAKQIIRAWLNSGVLVREDYHSEKDRKDVKGLVVNAAKRPGTVVRE